jgi:hypothetical protein
MHVWTKSVAITTPEDQASQRPLHRQTWNLKALDGPNDYKTEPTKARLIIQVYKVQNIYSNTTQLRLLLELMVYFTLLLPATCFGPYIWAIFRMNTIYLISDTFTIVNIDIDCEFSYSRNIVIKNILRQLSTI